jgi:hypothetical protein
MKLSYVCTENNTSNTICRALKYIIPWAEMLKEMDVADK